MSGEYILHSRILPNATSGSFDSMAAGLSASEVIANHYGPEGGCASAGPFSPSSWLIRGEKTIKARIDYVRVLNDTARKARRQTWSWVHIAYTCDRM